MPSPLVTVALPIYNGMPHLQRALTLIREQSYADLDIVLCDDASVDETPDVCAAAAREDKRIRFFRHSKNLGMNANFNFAMSQSRGEFFMWAGQDDEKQPTFVEETLNALLRNENASLACTATVLVTSHDERVHTPYASAISSPSIVERLAAFVAETQTVAIYGLFRSAVMRRIGPIRDWLDTDRHYLFNAAIHGPFEVVHKPLFRYTLIHSAEDYIRMGMRLRPGAADYDLDLYGYFPKLLRDAGVDRRTRREATTAIRLQAASYFDRRAEHLIATALRDDNTAAGKKLKMLFAWALQYPPMLRRRMLWGAARRIITRGSALRL